MRTVSLARAKKDKGSPLWISDPDQQLAYYTQRAWARLYVPELLMGVFTPDELGAVVEPDTRRLGAGEAVATTPRRGDAMPAISDRVAAARAEAIVETPVTDKPATEASSESQAADQDHESAGWNDEEWTGWLKGVSVAFATAIEQKEIDALDTETAPYRKVAPDWVRATYETDREEATQALR